MIDINNIDQSFLICEYIKKNSLGIIKENYNFQSLTSLKIGGIVRIYYEPNNVDDLILVMNYIKKINYSYFIIGSGTNLLFKEDKYQMVMISLKKMNKIINLGNNRFVIEAGVKAPFVGYYISKLGLTNAEFMALIPGSIGGLIYMNASCYKRGISDVVYAVEYLNENNEIEYIDHNFDFSYRYSAFQSRKGIILKGYFIFKKAISNSIPLNNIFKYLQLKRDTQPLNCLNAGSIFRNINNGILPTWKLIDELNLRGYSIGGAKISDVHTNFIINIGNATFDDMINLIKLIRQKVKDKYDIELECEWKIFTSNDFIPN